MPSQSLGGAFWHHYSHPPPSFSLSRDPSIPSPRSLPMAGNLMRAVVYDSYGAPLKHAEVPIPSPKKDQVLLKIEAASLNPVDWKIHKGMFRPFLPTNFPSIPVSDVAGDVVSVGPGVTTLKEGDKAVAWLSGNGSLFQVGGGLAEYAVTSANVAVERPSELPAAESSGLGVAGLTALQSLKAIGAKFDGSSSKPANVLITAASGGVGHYAVQLAKLENLHVTATCGARNLELVKSLGADEVLDYKTPEGAILKSPSGKKYDGVIHCASSIPWSTFEPNLAPTGKVIDITPSVGSMLTFALKKLTFSKKQLLPLLMSPRKEDLEFLVRLSKDGKIKTVIDSRHLLSKANEAWTRMVDGHATGKIVVEMKKDE